MKYTAILTVALAALVVSACHKKTSSTPAPVVGNNTTAPANVTNAIDSVAVSRQYKIDEYAGTMKDVSERIGTATVTSQMSFFVGHITKTTARLESSTFVQVDDIMSRTFGQTSLISDTVVFTGKGTYQVGRIAFRFDGTELGDSVHITWEYDNDNQLPDAGQYCDFEGVKIK